MVEKSDITALIFAEQNRLQMEANKELSMLAMKGIQKWNNGDKSVTVDSCFYTWNFRMAMPLQVEPQEKRDDILELLDNYEQVLVSVQT